MGPSPDMTDDEREEWLEMQALVNRTKPAVPNPGSERYWQGAKWWGTGIAGDSADALGRSGLAERQDIDEAVEVVAEEVLARLSVRDFPPTRDPEGQDFAHGGWTGQHIGLAWVEPVVTEDVAGRGLQFRVVEPFFDGGSIDFRLQDPTRPFGPVLRLPDPCGDTLLNATQITALVGELREMRDRAREADLVHHIDALMVFASRDMQPHSRLWFIGD